MSHLQIPHALRPVLRVAGAVAVATAVVVLAACTDDGGGGGGSTTSAASKGGASKGGDSTGGLAGLSGTSWALRSPAAGGAIPTLKFAEVGAMSGSTGCNSFAGTYAVDGDELRITLGPLTKMACTSQDATDQEQRILTAMPKVRGAEQTADSLTLVDGDGKELLAYTPVSDELAGTSWKVSGVNTGTALVTSALTEKLTLDFGTDGTVSGSGGCNRFNGPYTQDGTTITIGEMASTSMACAEDVQQLEDQYFAALAAATQVERSGDRLTLRDDGGAMQVTASEAG